MYGSPADGISATGLTRLTLSGSRFPEQYRFRRSVVQRRKRDGDEWQLLIEYDTRVSTQLVAAVIRLSDVIANNNGNTTPQGGSGINIANITGPSTVTNCTANNNHYHGLSVGMVPRAYSQRRHLHWNGIAGNAATGGGINVIAENTTTTSNITVAGNCHCQQQHNRRNIHFLGKRNGQAINTVTIGASGSVTLSNNGSTNGAYSGGAGVLIYGIVSAVHISNTTFTKGTNPGAGLVPTWVKHARPVHRRAHRFRIVPSGIYKR